MATVHQPDTPRNRGDHDAPHMSPASPAEDARTIMINKISWSAVLAGVVIALVTQLVLNMLGIGIGAATLDPATGDNPAASTFSIGAGLWFVLSGILASLAGGYAAGRLAGKPKESTAGWHGLTAWALTTLLVFFLLTSTLGGIVGGAYRTMTSALGNVASTVGSTVQTAAQVAAPNLADVTDPFSSVEQSIRGASGGTDPAALRDAAVAAVRAAVTGDEQQAQEARERAAQAIARLRMCRSRRRGRRSDSMSSSIGRRSSRRSSRQRKQPTRQLRLSRTARSSARWASCWVPSPGGSADAWVRSSRRSPLAWA